MGGNTSSRPPGRRRAFLFLAFFAAAAADSAGIAADGGEFADRVLPVLEARCFGCHSHAAEISGGLALDSRSGWSVGGASGPAVVPGDPDASPLVNAVRRTDPERAMPPDEPLPAEEVAILEEWVRSGAHDPRSGDGPAVEARDRRIAEGRGWWSLRPPVAVEPEEVSDPAWNRDVVDRFIRRRLDDEGIVPAPRAAPGILRRRLSMVLTGLPPVAFPSLPDDRMGPEATVDALLDSPHFGERFARHWMDVVRYGDTWGYEWDVAAKGSWEYRDWLVRAFNDDVGFDRLVREQIAGDLLPDRRPDRAAGVEAALVGPMFFHLGEHRHGSSLDFNGIHQEMLDNKIDAFSKAFLGLTIACARCHDHKLDPLLQEDYYALAGMFMTPRWTARDVSLAETTAPAIAELVRLRGAIQGEVGRAWSRSLAALGGAELEARLRTALPADPPPDADGVTRRIARLLAATAPGGAEADVAVAAAWREIEAEWRAEVADRGATRGEFVALVDPGKDAWPAGFAVEGAGMLHGRVDAGTIRVALEGDRVVAEVLPAGWHTHALSPKLPGVVRMPPPEAFPKSLVSLRVAGGEWAAKLVVPQNAFLNEGHGGPVFLDPRGPPQWIAVGATPPSNGVTRVLTEIATTAFNPNFPPRTGLAQVGGVVLPANDDGRDKRSWFSITGVVAHDSPGSPAGDPAPLAGLFAAADPATAADARIAVASWLTGAVSRWAEGKPDDGDAAVVAWAHSRGVLDDRTSALPAAAALTLRYREVEATLPFARTVTGMLEDGIAAIDCRINLRGDVDSEGPTVPRGFVRVLDHLHAREARAGSGRLELADHLAGGGNPLVARVWVNRVWQWVFGRGIVATPNDFGRLGAPPTHPELLDRLALDFMRDGWSTKRLVRRLVLTETFLQGSRPTAGAVERDPANLFLHHHSTRRLDAEGVRDAILAVSGRIDPRLGGPPVRPHRVAEDATKRLFSGPLDGGGRRSIYLEASIMAPPSFLAAFNQPAPKIPTGKRDVTSVPGQSLLLLNDPFVVAMADHWAGVLVTDGRSDPGARIDAMCRAALGRGATPAELADWRGLLDAVATPAVDRMADRPAWATLAKALFNTKEFIHVR